MADVRFIFESLDGKTVQAKNVASYEIKKDKDAPCDSLRMYFYQNETLDELVSVKAYCDDKIIFNGFVDVQKQSLIGDDPCYVFARSSAAVLVDNEAKPYTYYSPSAKALFMDNCMNFGFKLNLPTVACQTYYQVGKGTTCFAVIDNFINNVLGKHIKVTPKNVLELIESKKMIRLDKEKVISNQKIINRGCALTKIDYKITGESDYKYHRESKTILDKKINRGVIKNLTFTADEQKETTLSDIMTNANDEYYQYSFVVDGFLDVDLMDEISFKGDDNVFVSSIKRIFDKNGEKTLITAYKRLDLKEVSYVD